MKANNILYLGLQVGMMLSFVITLLHGLFFSGSVMVVTLFSIMFSTFMLWFTNRIVNKYQNEKLDQYIEVIYFFFNVVLVVLSLVMFFASEKIGLPGDLAGWMKLMSLAIWASNLTSCSWWYVVRYKPFQGRSGKI
jgi:hypothetical protein